MLSSRLLIPLLFLSLSLSLPLQGAEAGVILRYLDGSLVEERVPLKGGKCEVKLPPTFVEGSLRVVPPPGGVIDDVRFVPVTISAERKRELDRLLREREGLEDRLKALAVKEEIFARAARSQSSRTPKKTKTNPDPLATIREGTSYAVAQLEGVYRSRRETERRIGEIDRRLPLLRGEPRGVGSRVVVTASSADRVTIRYLDRTGGWTPRYRIELGERESLLLIQSDQQGGRVVPDRIGSRETTAWGVTGKQTAASVTCTTESLTVTPAGVDRIDAVLVCPMERPLPEGEVICIRHGAFAGAGSMQWRDSNRLFLVCGGHDTRRNEGGMKP